MRIGRFFIRRKPVRRRRKSAVASAHYRAHKELARERILIRLAHWHTVYQFPYGRVAIRDQSSRWGSCSKKGNLNFNYRIAFLPEILMDYVIVHELCHLKEFNHAPAFWNLVAETFPEYKKLRTELRAINMRTFESTFVSS